jgi:phosphoglycerate kinase
MKDGEIILLENTRYRAEETKNGEAFSKDLASLAEVFVNDAFGTAHRAHCSNVGVTEYIDTCVVGYLMQKEIDFLGNAVETPVRPFVAILGGAKVADKLNVISNLLEKCDTLIIGGGMAYTFQKAKGLEVGASLVDDTKIDYCKEMLAKAEKLGKKLLLPVDDVAVKAFPNPIDAEIEVSVVEIGKIPADMMGLDIGPKTAELLYGTDRWAYSKTRFLQKVPSQLQKHLLRQMQQPSSVVVILQQLLTSLDLVTRCPTFPQAAALPWNSWKAKSFLA